MYDMISFGPAGVDTLVGVDDANVHCALKKKNCEICLRYGDKIITKSMVTKTAYNAMNVAIGSARLGLKTAFHTAIGDDHSGERILATLKKEKVSTGYVNIQKGFVSNASVVIDYQGERTILVYHENFRVPFPKLAPARFMYLTSSIGREYSSLYNNLARYLTAHPNVVLGCNPGSYQLKDGTKKIKDLLRRTNVLFLNREEARLLTGIRKEKNIRQLLDGMRKLGADIAVITEGSEGSNASDGRSYWKLGIFPSPVIERTGCGDSFATAFMAALRYGYDIPEAMRWGTFNAASVLQYVGPQDGLLTIGKLRSLSRRHKRLQPRILS
ncbi:MAG: carbohydrate kinase family protein [Patescibacteria group bacterium]|jgi:sugar/nucleoside kinase (ribokinase family)